MKIPLNGKQEKENAMRKTCEKIKRLKKFRTRVQNKKRKRSDYWKKIRGTIM